MLLSSFTQFTPEMLCMQVLTAKVERALQKHSEALIHLRGPTPAPMASPLGNASNTITAVRAK